MKWKRKEKIKAWILLNQMCTKKQIMHVATLRHDFLNFFFSLIVSDTEPDCIHYKYEPLDSLKYLSYSREWWNKIQAFQFIFGHWCNSSNHKFEIIVSYYNNNNKTVLKWPSILSTTMLLSIMKGGAKSSEPFSVNVLICCLLW